MEAAPGITLGSHDHTEPLCRVSGYLRPVVENAKLIAIAPLEIPRLVRRVRQMEGRHNALVAALQKIGFEPFGPATASDREVLERITEYARSILHADGVAAELLQEKPA